MTLPLSQNNGSFLTTRWTRVAQAKADSDDGRKALAVARALDALRRECQAEEKDAFFDRVKPLRTGEGSYGEQAALAEASGMNLAAFRMAVHRLKKRLRQCVKAEVAGTLDDPAMIQAEMQTLFAALGG